MKQPDLRFQPSCVIRSAKLSLRWYQWKSSSKQSHWIKPCCCSHYFCLYHSAEVSTEAFFTWHFMFNRESTDAGSHSRPCEVGGGRGERGEKTKTEAVSYINETFKRHINRVDRLSGLAPPNIYISTTERTARTGSGWCGIFTFPVLSFY